MPIKTKEPETAIDPDNPPLRDDAKLGLWKDRFLQRIAQHKARVNARKKIADQHATDIERTS